MTTGDKQMLGLVKGRIEENAGLHDLWRCSNVTAITRPGIMLDSIDRVCYHLSSFAEIAINSAVSPMPYAFSRLNSGLFYIEIYNLHAKTIYHADVIVSIMEKTEKMNNEKTLPTNSTMLAGACMDCLFWYRCRGGKLDCLFRTPLAQTNGIRA